MTLAPKFSLLEEILRIDSPVGDEDVFADWLVSHLATYEGVTITRLADCIVAVRGQAPSTAVFAHIDTTGFTLGYDNELIPLGGPAPANGDILRPIGTDNADESPYKIAVKARGEWLLTGNPPLTPGTRLVYAAKAAIEGDMLTSPYLDNRAGVWAALQVLKPCENVAVAFTTGEEQSGGGAQLCARHLWETHRIQSALISDITWHTKHIHCGKGPAISLRDGTAPPQRFIRRITHIADAAGPPFQREVESAGGSDGGAIQKSGYPIDWAFVGAPEHNPHTSRESLSLSDLSAMADLLRSLVDGLSAK